MIFSIEQQHIIDLCVQNQNVIVDAVAGSGKTTTLLGIATAAAATDNLTLAVLYNKSLKDETRQKAAAQGLSLLEVHTYHALARKYYDNTICTDNGIISILKNSSRPIKQLPRWSRIIVDEVQDMNPLYFKLIKKIMHDSKNNNLRITVMGDRFQSIYMYMGADPRFLTHADKIFVNIGGPWINAKLSTTFRCSPTICNFINEGLIGYNRMIPYTSTTSSPVHYIYGSPFDAHRILVHYITSYLQQGFKPDDIFVLTTSVKVKGRDTPTRVLENALVALDIPVYVPNDETSELTDGSLNGKLVITTYHQSKGLERDIVIVYNFDNSYYYNKDYDNNILASPLYVAITRARKHLFVIHDSKQPPLSFYKHPDPSSVTYLTTYGTVLDELPSHNNYNTIQMQPSRIFMASELTNYLPALIIEEANSFLKIRVLNEPDIKVPLPSSIDTSLTTKELVSDINGIAIPALYEWRHSKKMQISQIDDYTLEKQGLNFAERFAALKTDLHSGSEPQMSTILELANIFSSVFSGYHFKVAQIKSYTWLKTPMVEPCLEVLAKYITSNTTEYEKPLPEQVIKNACIRGQVDAYSSNQSTLWEIKCTDTLDLTHNIQLAIYAWMFSRAYPNKFKDTEFHLINIRTGERRLIKSDPKTLEEMLTYLVLEKTRPMSKKTDEEFIKEFATKFETSYKQLTLTNMLKKTEPSFIDDAVMTKPKGRVIVFDLETNGLPDTPKFGVFYPPTDLVRYRTSRVVQWSWALYEPDGTLIKEEDYLIKPNLAEYRIMNHEIHGVTEALAKEKGVSFDEVLAVWKTSTDQATTIVGHNVNFDKNVLLSELHRRGHIEHTTVLESKEWVCTMERSTVLCGLKARNKPKPPKLKELMHALGIEEEKGRNFHNSRHDVYYTGKCYFAEQVVRNTCPKMYEGKHAGKTYDEILRIDREYAVNALAVCNVRKLYTSPLRKLSNWMKEKVKTDSELKAEVMKKEQNIRDMTL